MTKELKIISKSKFNDGHLKLIIELKNSQFMFKGSEYSYENLLKMIFKNNGQYRKHFKTGDAEYVLDQAWRAQFNIRLHTPGETYDFLNR